MYNTYKLYITDLTKAHQVLKDAGFVCEPKNMFLEVQALEKQKLEIVKAVIAAEIVMLDME